jgi:hypothetical protein
MKAMTLEEGGHHTGLSHQTLSLYVPAGLLTHDKIGRRIVISQDDLDQFLAERRIEAREGHR